MYIKTKAHQPLLRPTTKQKCISSSQFNGVCSSKANLDALFTKFISFRYEDNIRRRTTSLCTNSIKDTQKHYTICKREILVPVANFTGYSITFQAKLYQKVTAVYPQSSP